MTYFTGYVHDESVLLSHIADLLHVGLWNGLFHANFFLLAYSQIEACFPHLLIPAMDRDWCMVCLMISYGGSLICCF